MRHRKRSSEVFRLAAAALLSLALGAFLEKMATRSGVDGNPVYAVVNGQKITAQDVLPRLKSELEQLRRSEYELKKRATEEIIERKLLESVAVKPSTDSKTVAEKDVTPEEVNDFVKTHHLDVSKLTEREKNTLPQIVRNSRPREAQQKILQELRSSARIEMEIPGP